METVASDQQFTIGTSQTDVIDPLSECCKSCVNPTGEASKHVVCDFCGIDYHILCVGLEKPPVKGAKSRWFCQSCLKLPCKLRSTQEQLAEALQKIITLQGQLSKLLISNNRMPTDNNGRSNKTFAETVTPVYSPPKQSVAIVGDSILRDLKNEDFENDVVSVNCIRGAVVQDVITQVTNTLETESLNHVIFHVGTNDVAKEQHIDDPGKVLSDYEELITTTQIKCGSKTKIHISGPCPRTDENSDAIGKFNDHLKDLSRKLDCHYMNNFPSFLYGDGEVDSSLYVPDGVHLSRKGAQKLRQKFSEVGPVCLANLTRTFRSRPRHTNVPEMRSYRRDSRPTYYAGGNQTPSWKGHRHNPDRPTNRPRNSQGCYNCGELNHTTQGCRHDLPVKCRRCGCEGHKEKSCYRI